MLKSLNNKNLLKGQFDLLKKAASNRKATQEAYDKILHAKQVFVPEDNPTYVKNPSEGQDCWKAIFTKYEPPPKPDLPESSIRLPQSCVDKIKLMGYEAPVVGELFGWKHQLLGWRANMILTHPRSENMDDIAPESDDFVHLGFIRAGFEQPELTECDKKRLRSIAEKRPAIAVVISYPATSLISRPQNHLYNHYN